MRPVGTKTQEKEKQTNKKNSIKNKQTNNIIHSFHLKIDAKFFKKFLASLV